MKIYDMIKICVQNLLRRKSRTILTVLGVVIGCCSIVTMLSIGIGVQNSQQIMLEGMGDLTLIQVYAGGSNAKLNDEAINNFQHIANVDVALGKSSLDNVGFNIYAGEQKRYEANWAQVVGISEDAMEKFGFELIDGTFPKEKFQVLAGQYAAYNFMDTQRPDGNNMISRWDYMYQYNPETGEYEYNEEPEMPDPYFNILNSKLTMELYSYDDYEKKITQEVTVTGIVKQDYNKDYATSEGFIFFTSDLQALQKLVFPTKTQNDKNASTYSEIYVKAKDISYVADIESEISSDTQPTRWKA